MKGSGQGRNASESFKITNQRHNLQVQVDKFQSLSLTILKTNPSKLSLGKVNVVGCVDDLDLFNAGDEGDWLAAGVDDVIGEEEPEVTPEKVILYLPSNLTSKQRRENHLQELGQMEYELREGQANDALERLKECLAEKSMRFRTEVRSAKGQKKITRAWDSIHRADKQIKQAVITYKVARQAIGELGGAGSLKRFQEIKKSDLKMSGDIAEENRVGQRSNVLPWFWRLDGKVKENCGSYEKECKYCNIESLMRYSQNTVYRVNWLRARARAKRWCEEKDIVMKEMGWVIGTFVYMERSWRMRAEQSGNSKPGHRAYAAREQSRWNKWVEIAKAEFNKVTGEKEFL